MIVRQEGGRWPNLTPLIGSQVVNADLAGDSATLRLVFRHPDGESESEVQIPPPWNFTSCILACGSDEITTGDESGWRSASQLIGLEDATFTKMHQDEDHCDLVFDSITISIAAT